MGSFNQNVIKHKTGLLNLAAELGNISKTCRIFKNPTMIAFDVDDEHSEVTAHGVFYGGRIYETTLRHDGLSRVHYSGVLLVIVLARAALRCRDEEMTTGCKKVLRCLPFLPV